MLPAISDYELNVSIFFAHLKCRMMVIIINKVSRMSEIKDIFVIYISLHYKHVLYGV